MSYGSGELTQSDVYYERHSTRPTRLHIRFELGMYYYLEIELDKVTLLNFVEKQ